MKYIIPASPGCCCFPQNRTCPPHSSFRKWAPTAGSVCAGALRDRRRQREEEEMEEALTLHAAAAAAAAAAVLVAVAAVADAAAAAAEDRWAGWLPPCQTHLPPLLH